MISYAGRDRHTLNYLKAMYFDYPEWTPCRVGLMPATWMRYREDLGRQFFPFATPSQIEDHIGEVFDALHMPEGGLMLYAECEPDVPLEDIDAICTALERTCNPPEPAMH